MPADRVGHGGVDEAHPVSSEPLIDELTLSSNQTTGGRGDTPRPLTRPLIRSLDR